MPHRLDGGGPIFAWPGEQPGRLAMALPCQENLQEILGLKGAMPAMNR
jgi:hypothetical protein